MDNASINKVNKHVYRQFPELNGKSPNVQSYTGSKYLLLYKGSSKTADGKNDQQDYTGCCRRKRQNIEVDNIKIRTRGLI